MTNKLAPLLSAMYSLDLSSLVNDLEPGTRIRVTGSLMSSSGYRSVSKRLVGKEGEIKWSAGSCYYVTFPISTGVSYNAYVARCEFEVLSDEHTTANR